MNQKWLEEDGIGCKNEEKIRCERKIKAFDRMQVNKERSRT